MILIKGKGIGNRNKAFNKGEKKWARE